MLPILSGIEPPDIRKKSNTIELYERALENQKHLSIPFQATIKLHKD